jgi:hypothetical protein
MIHPIQYPEQQFGNTCVLSFQPSPNDHWKICIPTHQLEDVINWFHFALNHCGLHRLLKTINMHLYHPKMRSVAECVTKNCDTCQRQKMPGPQYGHLPPQNSTLLSWEDKKGMVKMHHKNPTSSMHSCASTPSPTFLMPSDYAIKQLATSGCNLKIYGSQDTQDQFGAYTIVAPNSWVPIFKESSNVLE